MNKMMSGNEIWYHGSNQWFTTLKAGSTITRWKELAEAFSHQPTLLSYEDDGTIQHNGTQKGYLYVINEPIVIGMDIKQHPTTTMDEAMEFLTLRDLAVKLVEEC